MLQRPQSLLLALIPLVMVCYLLLPLWSKTAGAEAASLSAYELVHTLSLIHI